MSVYNIEPGWNGQSVEIFEDTLSAMVQKYNPNDLPDQILKVFLEYELANRTQSLYKKVDALVIIARTLNLKPKDLDLVNIPDPTLYNVVEDVYDRFLPYERTTYSLSASL